MASKLINCALPPPTVVLILIAFLLHGCKRHKEPPVKAIYYWRTTFNPGTFEQNFLRQHDIRTLYVKFFDVDLNLASGKPAPIATLSAKSLTGYNIVPVVFITQNALRAMPDSSVGTYATLIYQKIRAMLSQMQVQNAEEIQVDCDWTASTREKYFELLKKMKKEAGSLQLSVTLRLYPFKYRHEMGVPPADRAMLMCYNMGNMKNPSTQNSIFDNNEMKKYLQVNQDYPLPLDVALPLFQWYVWFRGREYIGLAYPAEIKNLPVQEKDGGRWVVGKDTVVNGRLFRNGDWLRHEQVSPGALSNARKMIDDELGNVRRIALFHLDSLNLNKYNTDALEQIFRGDL
jgi:hypothetical protein